MTNLISNWWRSFQFKLALQQGNKPQAIKLLRVIEKSGVKLSWLERLFRDNLHLEDSAKQYKQEAAILGEKLNTALQELEQKPNLSVAVKNRTNLTLTPEQEFINFIYNTFNLIQHDKNKLQCTGIYEKIFDNFEAQLVEYLKSEFSRIPDKQLVAKLEDALEDINSLKCGKDPDYSFSLTPHVYYMKYFLENVYCVYLAWFIIYESGLLPTNINILDIAAGPGTVAYGLALFLQSTSGFFKIPQMHISYYSLEKQDAFQFRGLQFWRKYIESRKSPVNAFFRFVTSDIFDWDKQSSNIPTDFFDFVVISHCFFNDSAMRIEAKNIYSQIINNSLKDNGHAVFIIQDKKLYKYFDIFHIEEHEQEKKLVNQFVAELGLELVLYKYLTSTGIRGSLKGTEFSRFAREKLPKQLHISPILQKYLNQKYQSNYTLDDYIILAKKV
ncbi:photosystem II assembly protein [Plectonema cf. radiosum LEGE 06105]|uniref:Photosystem II assembly protein n=1 Tax=Plectonema cf. radiosum LEGE 06105 TaxID=945769 RepID=A0A8J7JV52_9CYAN|nr:photosystem II assembly protein [Plectonema radiosum]MBE9214240.1 photosystem II assembly protein [Plectonema cf. radiosum LEGE 06105]